MIKHWDKLLAIGSIVLATVAALRMPQAGFIQTPSSADTGLNLPVLPPVPAVLVQETLWPAPPAQPAGPGWVFEVFTPPIIYFDQAKADFVVTPPTSENLRMVPFDVEVIAIERELYRLQYCGHAGADGNYSVQIRNEENGRWYSGKIGAHIPEAAFRILDFNAYQHLITPNDAKQAPRMESGIRLLIRDERNGSDVELSAKPHYTDRWYACLRTHTGTISKLHEGDSTTVDVATYTLVALTPTSRTATLSMLTPGMSQPAEKTFTLNH
ncbi:MAG: hypothetical protein SFY80_01225 [Verrucomicrobiota bacterium]|nr:hypothetical protein [Verrucomicrobiota bacterium]